MESWISGNIPCIVDFAYVKALVLGTNHLKSSEIEAPLLGFEFTSVEENFEGVGLDFSGKLKFPCIPLP